MRSGAPCSVSWPWPLLPSPEVADSLTAGSSLSAALADASSTLGGVASGIPIAAVFGAAIGAGTALVAAAVWLYAAGRTTAPWKAQFAGAVAAAVVILGLALVLGIGLSQPLAYLCALFGGATAYLSGPRIGYEGIERVRPDEPVRG